MEGKIYNAPIKLNNRISTNSKQEVDLWQTQILIRVALKEIDKYSATQNKITQLENEYSEIQKSYKNFKKRMPILGVLSATVLPILVFLGVVMIIYVLMGVIINVFSLQGMDVDIESLTEAIMSISTIFACLTLPIFLAIYYFEKRNWKNKLAKSESEYAKRIQYEQELIGIKKNIVHMKSELNRSVVPKDYQNPYAVDWIVKAVENKRADTLKEAINLFEQHKSAEEIKGEIRFMRQSVVDAISNIEVEVNNYYYD